MVAQEPFTVSLEPNPLECWDDERTASTFRALAVRLHSTDISLRETAAVLEQFGVTRSHQAVFQWIHRTAEKAPDPPTASPSRVAVDETAVKIDAEQHISCVTALSITVVLQCGDPLGGPTVGSIAPHDRD